MKETLSNIPLSSEQLSYLLGEQSQTFNGLTHTMREIHENVSTAPSSHAQLHEEALVAGYQQARDYLAENPEIARVYRNVGTTALEGVDSDQFTTSLAQLEGYAARGLIAPEDVEAARVEFATHRSLVEVINNTAVFEQLFGDVVAVVPVEDKKELQSKDKPKNEEDETEWPPHRALDKSDALVLTNLQLEFEVDCVFRYALEHGAFRLEELRRSLAYIKKMSPEEYTDFKKITFPAIMDGISKVVAERGYRPIWVVTGRTRGTRYKLSTLIDNPYEEVKPEPPFTQKLVDAIPAATRELHGRVERVNQTPIERRTAAENDEQQAFVRNARFAEEVVRFIQKMAANPRPSSDKLNPIKQEVLTKLGISTEENDNLFSNLFKAEMVYKYNQGGIAFVTFTKPEKGERQSAPSDDQLEEDTSNEGFSEFEQKTISEMITHLAGRDVSRGETEQNLLRLVQDRLGVEIEPDDFKALTRRLAQTPHFTRTRGKYKGWNIHFANQRSLTDLKRGILLIKDEFPQVKVDADATN